MNINEVYHSSLLSQATYVNGLQAEFSASQLKAALSSYGNGITNAQAEYFANNFRVVKQETTTDNGFSATLFQNIHTNAYHFAMRGTDGQAIDWTGANLDNVINGISRNQIVDMLNFYLKLITPVGVDVSQYAFDIVTSQNVPSAPHYVISTPSGQTPGTYGLLIPAEPASVAGLGAISQSQSLHLTGHSLGGHLASSFALLLPNIVADTHTYNSAGFIGWVNTDFGNYAQMISRSISDINITLVTQDALMTNISAPLDFVSNIGSQIGLPIEIQVEPVADTILNIPENHSIDRLSDALAVADLLTMLDSNTSLGQINSLFSSAANQVNNSLENTVERLATLFGVPFNENAQNNDGVYQTINAIKEHIGAIDAEGKPIVGYQSQYTLIDLSVMTAQQLAISASEDIAYRHAVLNLNPFVVTGGDQAATDALYAPFSDQLDIQNYLDLDASNSNQYLEDRAAMLYHMVRLNQAGTPYDQADGTDGVYYEDATTGIVIEPAGIDENNAERIVFGSEANDSLIAGRGQDDRLYGNGGDDTINGGDGNDYIRGGDGNDELNGGEGNDTYVFNLGDGQDTINNYDTDGSTDTLELGDDISFEDLTFEMNGQDLLIRIKDTTDQITVQNYFNSADNHAHRINNIVIEGTTYSLLSLDSADAEALADYARYDIAHRYALHNLSPVVLVGQTYTDTQALYAPYADQLDITHFTNPYIATAFGNYNTDHTSPHQHLLDRATMLTIMMQLNINNIPYSQANAYTSDTYYEDLTTGIIIKPSGTSKDDLEQVIFGTENGETLTGGNRADRLYGNGGDDTFYGTSQSDLDDGHTDRFYGGVGHDTYHAYAGDDWDATDWVMDSDRLGQVMFDNQPLVGGLVPDQFQQSNVLTNATDFSQYGTNTGINGIQGNDAVAAVWNPVHRGGNNQFPPSRVLIWNHPGEGHTALGIDLGDAPAPESTYQTWNFGQLTYAQGAVVVDASSGFQDILLPPGLSESDVVFERNGNNLQISIPALNTTGTGNEILTLVNWFSTTTNTIQSITIGEVSLSVSNIAAALPNNEVFIGASQSYNGGADDTVYRLVAEDLNDGFIVTINDAGGFDRLLLDESIAIDASDPANPASILLSPLVNNLDQEGADLIINLAIRNSQTNTDISGQVRIHNHFAHSSNTFLNEGEIDTIYGEANTGLVRRNAYFSLGNQATALQTPGEYLNISNSPFTTIVSNYFDYLGNFGIRDTYSIGGSDYIYNGTEGDDVYRNRNNVGGVMYGGDGDDQLLAETDADIVDVMHGGAGNDYLQGDDGNDYYYIDNQDYDEVRENLNRFNNNTIVVPESVNLADLSFVRDGEDLLIDNVRIREFFDPDHGVRYLSDAAWQEGDTVNGWRVDLPEHVASLALNNSVPVLDNPITDQGVDEEADYTFVIPANTFSDSDGDTLTLAATLADGNELPSWLAFNDANHTFEGTPDNNDVGDINIRVTANDNNGGSVFSDFTLTINNTNDAPSANNDANTTAENTPVVITFASLLTNDSDVDTGDVLTITNVSNFSNGIAEIDAVAQTITFTPDTNYFGSASFDYTVSDDNGGTDNATVNITVSEAVNNDPQLTNALQDQNANENTLFSFAIPANTFSDADGDALTLTATLINGDDLPSWLNFNGTSFTGTPNNNDLGTLAIRITATDGHGGVNAFDDFTLQINAASPLNEIIGDDANNSLNGTADDDRLIGLGGNDNLYGRDGNDELQGGTGNDNLNGGSGADQMIGGLGNDRYTVDHVNDQVIELADEGTDTVTASVDYSLAGSHIENLTLGGSAQIGTGNDVRNSLSGNSSNNTLSGLGGNDNLYGRDGDDILFGGEGNDNLNGGADSDQMTGGLGDDRYTVDHANDQVIELAGEGTDTVNASVDYTLSAHTENLNLQNNALMGTGNTDNNILSGNSLDNTLSGQGGNDNLYGRDGNDILNGGTGDDRMNGGNDNDTYQINPGDGRDRITDSGGADQIQFGAGINVNDLWLVREGSHLVIYTNNTADRVQIDNWYSSNNNIIEQITTADGSVLEHNNIDALVAAMNIYTPPTNGMVTIGQADQNTVADAITSAWDIATPSGNTAPTLVNAIADQSINEDSEFTFAIPSNTFTDADGDVLTVSATLVNGDALPTWLNFTGNTFTGTPDNNDVGTLAIRITASDNNGGVNAVDEFTLTVNNTNDAPIANNDANATAENTPVVISFASLLANDSDVDAGYVLTIGGVSNASNGTAEIDAVAQTITFTPDADYFGSASFDYTVSDGNGGTDTATVAITVNEAVNNDPQVANAIADQNINEDANFSFTVPSNTFSDADGDVLTLNAILANGDALPSWLTFDGNAFSGTPSNNEVGSLTIRITASDNNGGVNAIDEFTLTVNNTNDAPLANNDVNTTAENTPVVMSFASLLTNDSDVDTGDILTITAVSNASNGTAVIDAVTQTITFTPDADYFGPASFDYTVSDGNGGTDTATVGISISEAVNNDPQLSNALLDQSANEGANFTFAVPSNTFIDADGDVLTLSATLANGDALPTWLTFTGTTFGGTPSNSDLGSLAIRVIASDGNGGVNATDEFTLDITAPSTLNEIIGDNTNNSLNGTADGDRLIGLGGNDNLYGRDGNDELQGGTGNDNLNGGSGADQMIGGLGNDRYTVDNINDQVIELADEGTDTVTASVDYSLAGSHIENLTLSGNAQSGTGSDVRNSLSGNSSNNILSGLGGNDNLYGRDGDDILFGGDGSDNLNGGGDVDQMTGGLGDDRYTVDHANDQVIELAGEGTDTVYASVDYSLAANLENLELRNNAITATGNDAHNTLSGTNGNNILNGLGGNDNLYGREGDDILNGGAGDDRLNGNSGSDTYQFGIGDDRDRITDSGGDLGDHLHFGAGITTSDLWFAREGSNLAIYLDGTDDRVQIDNWYTQNNTIEQIETATGDILLNSNVEQLVQAMSVFDPPSSGIVNIDQNDRDAVAGDIAIAWS